jgi:endonuclease YncB( thermonuclease family)
MHRLLALRRYAVVLRAGPAGTSVCRRSDGATDIKSVAVLIVLTLLLFPLLALTAPAPNVLEGRVIHVADGDTITVLDSNNVQHRVRLAGIDAPEKGQPFGDRSRQSLSRTVMGKDVKVVWSKQDRYGRLVGTIWVAPPEGGCRTPPCPKTLDVNLAQLTVGLAWHFKKYADEQSPEERERYAFAEEEAREMKAGLWSQPDPVSPWQYRHGPTDGPVKKSRSGICHAPGTSAYSAVTKFTAFPTLDACLESGGRLPNQPGR